MCKQKTSLCGKGPVEVVSASAVGGREALVTAMSGIKVKTRESKENTVETKRVTIERLACCMQVSGLLTT